ncbi:MAG: 4-phosphopantoate--beta-alanine ligase [Euryarchaeota archaeon]|nr:4-phosphopantoate--beta-alanine ligase [Euryarchaeota archaeon]
MTVPESHPRYQSLRIRAHLVAGVKAGITSQEGLIAHGRGEAFDYLLGERTINSATHASQAAAALLLAAKRPILSVNGNVAALVPDEIIELSRVTGAQIEINLFYRTENRVRAIANHLRAHGASAQEILGEHPDAALPLDHARSRVCAAGIHAADAVLVPLEDGDRCQALASMGKSVIAIDLNPLSRTAEAATITIIDNVVRAIPNMTRLARQMKGLPDDQLNEIAQRHDNKETLQDAIREIVSQ